MPYPPTQIVVTYLTYSAADPAVITTATVTLNIPVNCALSDYIRGIANAGFVSFPQNPSANPPAQITIIPWPQIISIVAS